MRKVSFVRVLSNRFVSVLLMLSVMLSLVVPFDITVAAEGESTVTDDGIYACLYLIDPTKAYDKNGGNLELVFNTTNVWDETKKYAGPYVGFASTLYITQTYKYDGNWRATPTFSATEYTLNYPCPWHQDSNNGYYIRKVTFEDTIKPKYTAGWFRNCRRINEFNHLERLDTSECESMTYMFYDMNNEVYSGQYLSSLDLSTFDTRNVKHIDYFIRSYELRSLDVSGMKLTGIGENVAITSNGSNVTEGKTWISYLRSFITSCVKLNTLNVDGLDVSKIEQMYDLISGNGQEKNGEYTGLRTLDLSNVEGPESVYNGEQMFCNNVAMEEIIFGRAGHPFKFATDPKWHGEARSLKSTSNWMGVFLGGNTSLKKVDFTYFEVNKDYGYQQNSLFRNCKNLKEIINLGNIFGVNKNGGYWSYQYMFDGCESLQSIDLSALTGYLGGPSIFRNCKSLKSIDLSGMGTRYGSWEYNNRRNFDSFEKSYSPVKNAPIAEYTNIFEGCDELSEFVLSPYYPPADDPVTDTKNYLINSYVNSVPPDRTWTKIKLMDQKTLVNNKSYNSDQKKTYQTGQTYPENEVPVDEQKTTTQLFRNFQAKYAGTWVAEADIYFDSDGGAPAKQSVKGTRGQVLTINEGDLTIPTKTGYNFDDWYYDDSEGVAHKFVSGEIAQSWNYYAKWTPIEYTVVLHSNESTDQTNTYTGIKYDEFFVLRDSEFVSEESGKILSGWCVSAAGNGKTYAANESVDKLTSSHGHTVHLYAVWTTPDAVISFDTQCEEADRIADKHYTLTEGTNTPYGLLSEPIRDGYTFVGWYTLPNGAGRKVVEIETDSETQTAYVSGGHHTLYAYWQKKPTVTFKLNGGDILGNTSDYIKVVDYSSNLGNVPTPSNGSATFKGWFSAAGNEITSAEDNGGISIDSVSDKVVTENLTYTAHWGYQPKFETNGGSYIKVYNEETQQYEYVNPRYPVLDTKDYPLESNLYALPTVERPNYTFVGWFRGDTQISDGNDLLAAYEESIDLSEGDVFTAHWEQDLKSTVTLDPNGGSYSSNGAVISTVQDYTVVYTGSKVGELPTPTKKGFTFLGWYASTDTEHTTRYTYQSTISGDITLKAWWSEVSHTVTFVPDYNEPDGAMVGATEYDIPDGKTFTYLPGANCITGTGADQSIKRSFDGWYLLDGNGELDLSTQLTPQTQITSDVTYYAKWVDNRVNTPAVEPDYSTMIRWSTLSDARVTNSGDTLVFHPEEKGNVDAHLTIDFALLKTGASLKKDYVRITLPKEVYLGWDGTDKTSCKDTFSGFTATQVGGNFVLTNTGQFQSTVIEEHYTVDPVQVKGGYTDEDGVYRNYYSNSFDIKIEIYDENAETWKTVQERTLGIEFHTSVNTSIIKEQSTATLYWDPLWGPEPADSNEYFYVTWNLKSNNINSTQPYKLSWSENPVYGGGSIVYAPDLDKWTNDYSTTNEKNIQVVTKHRRDEATDGQTWTRVTNEAILNVRWKSELENTDPENPEYYEQQLRAKGTASAFVGEDFLSGVRSFKKDIPLWGDQTKHIVSGGQDLILNDEADVIPALRFNYTYQEKYNDDNPQWTPAGEMSIDERTYTISDGIDGRNDVLIQGVNKSNGDRSSWTGDYHLDVGDYAFTYLDIHISEYDSVYLNSAWAAPYENNNRKDYHPVKVYYRRSGGFESKTYSLSDLEVREGYSGYFVRVQLPDNTIGFKIEYVSDRYTTNISVESAMTLKNSAKLHSIVSSHAADGKVTLIKNKAEMQIDRKSTKTETLESKQYDAWNSTYELTLSESALYADKNCYKGANASDADYKKYVYEDPLNATVEFPVAISGWAYSKSVAGYIKRIKSGIFYDLLPSGYTVERSKVKVCVRNQDHCDSVSGTASNGKGLNGDKTTGYATSYKVDSNYSFAGEISDDYYSITFDEDWEGSGRTMMIIRVNCPENIISTGFVVYYKCKTPVSNLHINGTTVPNYIAFKDTTPGQSRPETRTRTIGSFSDATVRNLFESIDDNRQTAFALNETTLKAPNVYQYGADSTVHTDGSNVSNHQYVGLNTPYSYNISYEGSTSHMTTNLIFYDVIERQINGSESEWRGNFLGVNVDNIKNQSSATAADGNCNPVVYYVSIDKVPKDSFTREMFDLDYKINGEKIWTATKPDNDKVAAIAVDCTKTTLDKDFVLGINRKGLEFTINMRSPVRSDSSDITTYNQAVITGKNPEASVKDFTVYADTSVTLRFVNPRITKKSFPETGDEDDPETVVKGSLLTYTLTLTNPDPDLEMNNIIVEDRFPSALVPEDGEGEYGYKVCFNDGATIPIDNTQRVDYTVSTDSTTGERVFSATIEYLYPNETVAITIPVRVGLDIGTNIVNEAQVLSANGVSFVGVTSNKTYHVVTGVKAKVFKTNAKGTGLAGAELQIYADNDTNFDESGDLKVGAEALDLYDGETHFGTTFTSTADVMHFDIAPGSYVLHEAAVPAGSDYKLADDIRFTVDVEGVIRVGGEKVNHVEMIDEPAYKIIFHENNPQIDDKNVIFKIVEPGDLVESKIPHFYDIPEWAGDEYVFKGWYYDDTVGSEFSENPAAADTPVNFEAQTYTKGEDPHDYHIYAQWIEVGTVAKSSSDLNDYGSDTIRAFGLEGVQIRDPGMTDSNHNNEEKPQGLRFVTSLSETLLSSIEGISGQPVEYGYVVALEKDIQSFVQHYGVEDTTKYKLQYCGTNVNGVNTSRKNSAGEDLPSSELDVSNDFRYVTNVNCTSRYGGKDGVVDLDHRNFQNEYRLYTLVVTYEGEENKKNDKLDARAYLSYCDANGKVRVFYNDYKKNMYYGGCLCSFNQISQFAISKTPTSAE